MLPPLAKLAMLRSAGDSDTYLYLAMKARNTASVLLARLLPDVFPVFSRRRDSMSGIGTIMHLRPGKHLPRASRSTM